MPGLLDFLNPSQQRGMLDSLLNDEQKKQRQMQSLQGLAQGLLSASGPSRTPVSFGQALGAGMQGMDQAKQSYMDNVYKQMAMGQQMQRAKNTNAGGATGELVDRLMKENPGMSFGDALYSVQTGWRQGMQRNSDGSVSAIPGYAPAKGDIKQAEKYGTDTGANEAEREAGYTMAQSALKGFEQQVQTVTGTIDKALKTINKPFSAATGYGQAFSFLPNTDSRELNNYLNTIKANVGFDKLQQMRDNSKTGGALGQVSELENKLLQAVNGALDPLQSEQLVENLNAIKELYPAVLAEKQRAFAQDYGNVTPLGNNPVASPTAKPAPADLTGMSDEELLRALGG